MLKKVGQHVVIAIQHPLQGIERRVRTNPLQHQADTEALIRGLYLVPFGRVPQEQYATVSKPVNQQYNREAENENTCDHYLQKACQVNSGTSRTRTSLPPLSGTCNRFCAGIPKEFI